MAEVIEKHIFFLDNEQTICKEIIETLKDSNIEMSCFSNPFECLAQLRSKKCDLLITALKIPEKDGFEILMDVQHQTPWIPVLVITRYGDVSTAVKTMKAGAVDFIEKPLEKKNFVLKIKSILKKNVYTHSNLGAPLTQQEKKILQLIFDSKSNREIAIMFHRSICTIEVHRAHIMNKLGVNNRVDLIKRAVAMGLVDLGEKS